MTTKLFSFRCPAELLTAIEEMANAQGVSKSEAVLQLIERGLAQGSGIPLPEQEAVNKTLEVEELEERLTAKTRELIEVSYTAAIEQVNGLVQTLREEFSGELRA